MKSGNLFLERYLIRVVASLFITFLDVDTKKKQKAYSHFFHHASSLSDVVSPNQSKSFIKKVKCKLQVQYKLHSPYRASLFCFSLRSFLPTTDQPTTHHHLPRFMGNCTDTISSHLYPTPKKGIKRPSFVTHTHLLLVQAFSHCPPNNQKLLHVPLLQHASFLPSMKTCA